MRGGAVAAALAATLLGPLACSAAPSGLPAPRRFGVYVELFAHGRVILLPAGIGVAPPRREVEAHRPPG